MTFCSNCGTAVEGRFCAKCGTPVGGTAPASEAAAAGSVPPGTGGAVPSSAAASAGLTDSVAGALCYLGLLITGILFLVLEPYNRNRAVRFHAFQAIFLNLAWIVVWFAMNVVLGALHIGGFFFGLFLSPLVWLAFLVLWIYMIVTTYQGKTTVLPVIGPLAQQQA